MNQSESSKETEPQRPPSPTIGSQWRIWDLHVHPPQVRDGNMETFISNIAACDASVIGINDYCSLNSYKEIIRMGGVPSKVLFPVVEFRMHNVVTNKKASIPASPGGKINLIGARINFHIIFDNDPEILESIAQWLNSQPCYEEGPTKKMLGSVTDLGKVTFQFEDILKSLEELFKDRYLVWLPYDEYGGIDDIDPTDSFFKQSLILKADILGSANKRQIDFFKWKDTKHTKEEYEKWMGRPKPCIKGSDAHNINYPFGHLANDKSEPIDKFCWINADPTFAGLKQILVETDRVFIGGEPGLLKRVKNNPTKFIKTLRIRKIAPTDSENQWFENFDLNFNSSLVAIIGNKGSGKSAITDIISLAANTDQDPNDFSFLTVTKFRKSKPFNLSERFEATLEWCDGTSAVKRLSNNPDKNQPSRVKYIPQNFLEKLCVNIDQKDFESELMKIIYSHTPSEKRLGKSSLEELILYKTSLINEEVGKIKTEISSLNSEIIILENKSAESYKIGIENKLTLKNEEINAHEKIKPEKPKDEQSDEKSKLHVEKLTKIRENIDRLEKEIIENKATLTGLNIRLTNLDKTLQFYTNLSTNVLKQLSGDYVRILTENSIDPKLIFSFNFDPKPISDVILRVKNECLGLEAQLDPENNTSKTFKINSLKLELDAGQNELDRPAKAHQKYLDEFKMWEEKKALLIGASEVEQSLKFYESQIDYLKNKLLPELKDKKNQRNILCKALFAKKLEIINERKSLFEPVSSFIEEFKELKDRYDIKLDVSLEAKSFSDGFLNFVNQSRAGSFAGKEDGYKRVNDIMEKATLTTEEGYVQFLSTIEENLKTDRRNGEKNEVYISNQLKKGIEAQTLYDYLYHADYLQPIYSLNLGKKSLQELSPGERGALLLIFYLVLDKDDIPLIIDQPEENLDNETIYHVLVHFIKRAKEKRQIIIVTHNPNLAVVCDADQVVHMQIEKDNKNTAKYYSGAIENPITNKVILNILEGTLPAFNNRDSKYIR